MRYRFEIYKTNEAGHKVFDCAFHREITKADTTFKWLVDEMSTNQKVSHANKECRCYARKGRQLLWICTAVIGVGLIDFNWEYLYFCGFNRDVATVEHSPNGVVAYGQGHAVGTWLAQSREARSSMILRLTEHYHL